MAGGQGGGSRNDSGSGYGGTAGRNEEFNAGGGGGGAGGGNGGNGGSGTSGAGGTGGTATQPNGGVGSNSFAPFSLSFGAGGGGGYGGANGNSQGVADFTNNASVLGSNGGNGGNGGLASSLTGSAYGGGGGGGGAGGYGAINTNGTASNFGTIGGGTGGAGGAGGFGNTSAEAGGNGGDGGIGLYFAGGTALNNAAGAITGGDGGLGGSASFYIGRAGLGGAGVVGSGLNVSNTGTITGGTGFAGRADAIDFTGGTNSLTLGNAATQGTLTGGIGIGGTLSIDPGTAASGASRTLANQIHNYSGSVTGALVKTGEGTLSLSGVNIYTGGTTLKAGTLDLNAATRLGKAGDILSGSAGTGPIAFTAGAQTLKVETVAFNTTNNTSDLAYKLSGFAADGDRIDLTNISATGATAQYDAGTRTLTVTSGLKSATLHFDSSFQLQGGARFVLAADTAGTGTFVSLIAQAPAAPTGVGTVPSTGNSVTFDGSLNVTAAKGDLLVFSLDPQNFAGGAEQNGNVVLSATNGTSATITNAFLTSDGIPNTFVPQGDFLIGRAGFSITSTKQNSILLGANGGEINNVVDPNQAAGSHFISGGVGRFDSTDGADTITFGGKGKWSVFANAGADVVTQDSASTSAFDSASVVNVYGQEGNDQITLTNAANKASIFVSGGTGADGISVVNSGATTIFGGIDSADSADSIAFTGVNGAGGTSVIFGNGGNDTISVAGGGTGLQVGIDSTSTTTIFGGFGDDKISVVGYKATVNVLGGEGADNITVFNNGTTYITGGNQSGDQSLDGADTIDVIATGKVLIYGNVGADSISLELGGFANDSETSNVSIYGGRDGDTISQTASLSGNDTVFIAGGEGGDTISAEITGGALTVWGGISSSDSTDGSDSITIVGGSHGAINVFANGGDDTVSIGTLGADSVNTATIYGGGGADSIVIEQQLNGGEALVLTGNEGNDTFTIAKGTGQTITVTDFATSGDKLALTDLTGTAPGQLQLTSGSFQTLQQALDAAANASGGNASQNKAAAVSFAGSTYVVIEAGGAGFQAGTDQAIKLTGVTDLVGLIGQTTITGSNPIVLM